MIVFEFLGSNKHTRLCFLNTLIIANGDPIFDQKKYGLAFNWYANSFFPSFSLFFGTKEKHFNSPNFGDEETHFELEPKNERVTRAFQYQNVEYVFHSGVMWTFENKTNKIISPKTGAWIIDENLKNKTPLGSLEHIPFCNRSGAPKDLEMSVRQLVSMIEDIQKSRGST